MKKRCVTVRTPKLRGTYFVGYACARTKAAAKKQAIKNMNRQVRAATGLRSAKAWARLARPIPRRF